MTEFYKLPIEIASRRDLPGNAKIVAAVLIDRIGRNDSCWPGVRTIAKDTGLSIQAVIDSVHRLEIKQIFQVNRQGSGKANRYFLNSKSAQEIRAPKKLERTKNLNSGALKSSAQAPKKLEQNQRDQLNQTKERESKRRTKFTPPTLEEVQEYISRNNYNVDAKTFHKYFTEGNWHDRDGKVVRNWKQKIISWAGRDRKTDISRNCGPSIAAARPGEFIR